MRRSIIAVLAGWTMAVLIINGFKWMGEQWAADGSSFLIFLAGIFAAAAAGGYLAARLAERAPKGHAAAVGVLVACIFFRRLMVHHPGPVWSDFWPFWVALAGAIVGGSLRGLNAGN